MRPRINSLIGLPSSRALSSKLPLPRPPRVIFLRTPSRSTLLRHPSIPKPSFGQPIYRNMSSETSPDRYKLVFYVPTSHLDACKDAVFETGAGSFNNYSRCCFQSLGQGQFQPSDSANPAIGTIGSLESVEEMKVEIMCPARSIMLRAVEALVKAHPYEEVAYEVYKMENV